MQHIAILRKAKIKQNDNLLGDILAGTKTIESRWYVNKIAPWNQLHVGETIYFKETGQPITAKATIANFIQYENLTPNTVSEIITNYGKQIAPNTSTEEFYDWAKTQQHKRFCILVFLTNVQKITPFNINKSGFGSACAWMVTKNINSLKLI